MKCSWDELLPDNILKVWTGLSKDLNKINEIQIPRYTGLVPNSKCIELHCFCDASAKAYAACIYLRTVNKGEYISKFIFSKSRVAPLRGISLPRLELLAVLIGVRMIEFVSSELALSISRKTVYSDSTCVLSWIQSKRVLPVFIENRLKEIRKDTTIEFRHVQSVENSADLATRGKSISDISDCSLWWQGPDWLIKKESYWPVKFSESVVSSNSHSQIVDCLPDSIVEVSVENTPSDNLEEKNCFKFDDQFFSEATLKKYSSLKKLLRVTALVFRFIHKLKKRESRIDVVSADELTNARNKWEIYVQRAFLKNITKDIHDKRKNSTVDQLGLYFDEIGFIRCRGRFINCDLTEDAKYPKLLPKHSEFTRLVIDDCHRKLYHVGTSHTLAQIRLFYWIPQGRAQVKKVIKKCLICRRWEGGPFRAPAPPPLPSMRVTRSAPFTYTGIDYAGPLFVRELNDQYTKVWISLFTCAVTRAIHLELVQNLSTEEFILCFRRFISRRGTPKTIISDNAKHFKLANQTFKKLWANIVTSSEVQNYVSNQGIEWKFIVELAPWMGGFYERLIGSVKRTLKKVVGKTCLTSTQLETVITEIEAVINCRPLVFVDSELTDDFILTPGHFLSGSWENTKFGLPNIKLGDEWNIKADSADKMLEKWKAGQKLLNQFWCIWSNDYLLSLRERNIATKQRASIDICPNVGDIVLIKDKLPRAQWRLARIASILKGVDGKIRSAIVRSKGNRLFQRSIKQLYPIELSNTNDYFDKGQVHLQETNEEKSPKRRAAINARKKIKQQLMSPECRDEHE